MWNSKKEKSLTTVFDLPLKKINILTSKHQADVMKSKLWRQPQSDKNVKVETRGEK